MMRPFSASSWLAFTVVIVLMCFWVISPLGAWAEAQLDRIDPELGRWGWPVAGVSTYWLARLALWLLPRKRSAESGAVRP